MHTRSWMGKRTLGAEGLASPGHRSALVLLCERDVCGRCGAAAPLVRCIPVLGCSREKQQWEGTPPATDPQIRVCLCLVSFPQLPCQAPVAGL